MSVRILLADDEPSIRFLVSRHLQRRGWRVDEVATGTEALDSASRGGYEALVLDQRMPGMTGVEVARELPRAVPIFLFSAFVDDFVGRQAAELGCTTIDKGDIEQLLRHLDEVAANNGQG